MKTDGETTTEETPAVIVDDKNSEEQVKGDVLDSEDGEDSEKNAADDKPKSTAEDDDDDDEPLSINLGDEDDDDEEPSEANSTIKQMRAKLRTEERERKRLEAELAATKAEPAKAKAELGDEPSLEDLDYDEDAYKTALLKWTDAKRENDAAEATKAEAQKVQSAEWGKRVKSHEDRRSEMLEHPEYEDAEATVLGQLSKNQQYMAVRALKNAPHVFLALGKRPARLTKLISITDEVDFIAAIVREEAAMKITGTKAKAPKPERKLTGGNASPSTGAKHLKELEDEAERTGNRTKVQQYRRAQEAATS